MGKMNLFETVKRDFPKFITALQKWDKAGKPIVNKETFEHRLSICRACPHHYEIFSTKIMVCKLCNCTTAKLLLGTSECPDNPPRWKKVETYNDK